MVHKCNVIVIFSVRAIGNRLPNNCKMANMSHSYCKVSWNNCRLMYF